MSEDYDKCTECPECGCEEYAHEDESGKGYRLCESCGQDWWVEIDYKLTAGDKRMAGFPETICFDESGAGETKFIRENIVEKMLHQKCYLPKIDTDILDLCAETCLIGYDRKGGPQWTQEAVDFIAALNFAYAKAKTENKE